MVFVALISVFAIGIFIYGTFVKSKRNSRLPPQVPWTLPVLGHLLYLGSFPYKKFRQWKEQYGPMYLINMGSFRTLVINDSKILKEASKSVFSDRPPLPTFANCNNGILFNDYNKGEQRNFFVKQIRIFSEKGSFVEEQLNEGLATLLTSLSEQEGKPIPMKDFFTPIVINSVWGILMGSNISPDDPDLTKLIFYTNEMAKLPGTLATVGNFIPWLARLFPGVTGDTRFSSSYQNFIKFTQDKINEKKKLHVEGQPMHILDAYLDIMHETTHSESTFFSARSVLPNSFGEVLFASLETTSSAMVWCILLLGKYPQVQKKIQEEITRIVGESIAPSVQHRPNMPYTEAFIAEVFRWTSFLPIGNPHFTKENAELCGYIIPKDTMLLQNTYGIHHDPEIWGDPEEFRPERFLDLKGKFQKSEHLVIFGHGRRLCLGDSIAKDQLFLIISRLVQRFDVSFGEKNPSLEMAGFGFVMHPEPFEAVFTERL